MKQFRPCHNPLISMLKAAPKTETGKYKIKCKFLPSSTPTIYFNFLPGKCKAKKIISLYLCVTVCHIHFLVPAPFNASLKLHFSYELNIQT